MLVNMNTIMIFLIFIPILSGILLAVNILLAPSNPYKEKKTPFECGYHSFIWQSRMPFTVSYFIFSFLFLTFDIELLIIFPYPASSYFNDSIGLSGAIIFILVLTLGFVFELGKNALSIDTKQDKKHYQNDIV